MEFKIKPNFEMNTASEGLNDFPFLTQQQTPPTSCRTIPSPKIFAGQTSRRSLPKNLHGNYEGDLSMFHNVMKDFRLDSSRTSSQQTGSLVEQILEGGLDLRLDQHLDASTTEDHLDDDADEIVDEEIRAKIAEMEQPKNFEQSNSYWQRYKCKFLTEVQCKKIDATWNVIQQNVVYQKVSYGCKLISLMILCILRMLLYHVIMRIVDMSMNAIRRRHMLRNGSHKLLWCMALAKCSDLQLFGLILLLSPLLFLVAVMGFISSLYTMVKQGVQSFIAYVHYMHFEASKLED